MKRVILLNLLIIFIIFLQAQENKMYITIKGAPSISSTLLFPESLPIEDSDYSKSYSKFSYAASLQAGFNLTEKISFEFGLQFKNYRYTYKRLYKFWVPEPDFDGAREMEWNRIWNFNFLNNPILLKFNKTLNNKLILNSYIGLSPCLLLNQNYTVVYKYNNKKESTKYNIDDIDFNKRINIGLLTGIEFQREITEKISLIMGLEGDIILFSSLPNLGGTYRLISSSLWLGVRYQL